MRLLCWVWLIASFSSGLMAQETFKYEKKLQELAQPYLKHRVFQSAVVGVIHEGKTWTYAFGTLDEDKKKKPDENTLYEIGSITKVFTGILLADAIIQKQVELNQPIAAFAPQLAQQNPELMNKITFQQLAQHMSGLPRMPDNTQSADPNNPFANYDRTLLHAFLQQHKLLREPGSLHEYSNLGFGLLGDLLAEKAGVDYETLLRDRIFKPLEMADTCIDLSESSKAKFAPPTNSALAPEHAWDFDALAGAGAIRSSAKDMVRFMQANLNPAKNEIGQAMELAWKESLPAGKDNRAMGLGWMLAGDGVTRWHNGQTGGYHSMMLINRDLKAGLVFLCNTATIDADQLAESMFQAIAGMNVKPRNFDGEVKVDASILQRLTGNYQLAPGVVITITTSENRLLAQLTGQQALRIYPENNTVWNYREVVAQLRFDLPSEGSATQVTLLQNGNVLPAPRVKE